MRWDLKTPCLNCPFRTDATAIRFAVRERAEEIEESAYRNGFPCHLSAVNTSTDDMEDEGGFEFGPNTQHCAGATIMFLQDGQSGNVPFEELPDEQQDAIRARLDWRAPVWENGDAFLDSYPEEVET